MRITILAHAEPGDDETFCDGVGQVAAGLRKGGHRVSILGVHCEIGKLISGMKRRQPDLIFNMMTHDPPAGPGSVAIVGLLELLGLPYTGNGPGEFYLQGDPALVKPLLGLNGQSNGQSHSLTTPTRDVPALDEYTVGLIGNEKPQVFSPVNKDPSSELSIDEKTRDIIREVSRTTYRSLRVRDFGLVDVQVLPGNAVHVIGPRPQCELEQSGEFARSAAAAGVEYVTLINQIADFAIERAGLRPLVRLI
jgi:hypothetical protein